MIDPKCFSRTWLDACRGEVGRIDPGLLEKSIYAFELVGRLAAEGLPFVFKGGTCMLLLLDAFRRLSIDVDIACPLPAAEVARLVGEAASKGPFLAVEPDARDPNRLPKRHHYRVLFNSVVNASRQGVIQLDVLEDDGHYPQTRIVPIRSRFIAPLHETKVTVPTIEGLLADKLTAFAPTTIGVPYTAFKASIKIVKHAADIGELFVHAKDGPGLRDAYQRIYEAENRYRGGVFSPAQALQDTIEAARLLNSIQLRGYQASPESKVMHTGVAQVNTHMIGPHFTLDDAKVAAARAARLAASLRGGNVPEDLASLRYLPDTIEISSSPTLVGTLHNLNRLEALNPEAFYHWTGVQALYSR